MAGRRPKVWMLMPPAAKPLGAAEKGAFIAACDALIADVLTPRFLPVVKPTTWNYPVAIRGAYSGGRYRFITRYRSGFLENKGKEFDAPFARLDRIAPDQFNVQWMRHTGSWWQLRTGLSLADAIHTVATDGILHAHFATV